jgi:hypothetical protein
VRAQQASRVVPDDSRGGPELPEIAVTTYDSLVSLRCFPILSPALLRQLSLVHGHLSY